MKQLHKDIIGALDRLRVSSLYVHNAELPGAHFSIPELNGRKVYLVETLAVINAIVERGTMMLYGGHGGGKTTLSKYLGQIFMHYSKDKIEDCILRGHPQLTEEKILGSLDFAQMMNPELIKEGKVKVIWNDFVDSSWKIIDEINRLSPYAQNILLSLLAEGSVKYHNQSRTLAPFTLFATMNPKDNANFELSLPFLDRFALALPITMPDYDSFSTIGRKDKIDNNLNEWLRDFSLQDVQEEVKNIHYTDEAELFVNFLIDSYRLCCRISKETNESLSVDKTLCKGCHMDAKDKVCCKIKHPLSVRVKEDLYRYGKAIAWFLGDEKVEVKHIEILAPYLIWHRSELSKKFCNELVQNKCEHSSLRTDNDVLVDIQLDATKDIIKLIRKEFDGVKSFLFEFEDVKKGKLSEEEFDKLISASESSQNNFLILTSEIVPILKGKYAPVYNEICKYNDKISITTDFKTLKSIKDELAYRYDIPNRAYIFEQIVQRLRVLQSNEYTFTLTDESIKSVDSIRNLVLKVQPNFPKRVTMFKKIPLMDFNNDECELAIKCISQGKWEFYFKGEETNIIYKILSDING
jgi:energy-coupling factor transporter ATP-binding protein EcfA2